MKGISSEIHLLGLARLFREAIALFLDYFVGAFDDSNSKRRKEGTGNGITPLLTR